MPIREALHALPEAEAAPLWEMLNDLEMYYAGKASIMLGVSELLQYLFERDCRLAILTRNTMPVVQHTLGACGIEHYFEPDYILDRDSCIPKPSPDGINQLLGMCQA